MATKSRRPVALATPMPAVTPKRKAHTGASKQALLDNFDLEVSHRTSDMRNQLDSALGGFLALVDAEIFKIPRAMRSMTLGELEVIWRGNFAETSRAMAEQKFERAHPDKDHAEVVAAAVEGKRKREAQSPHENSRKSARTKPLPALPGTPAGKRVTKSKRKLPAASPLPKSTSMSTIPQDYEFNPLLPKTPKFPRAPKRNESFFSQNGSPVDLNGIVALDDVSNASVGSDDDDDDEDDDDELPDPEKMERRALAASLRHASPRSKASSSAAARSRPKRAPSLIFRQSLGAPAQQQSADEERHAEIPLSDGRTITFNPLNLTPGRIDDELAYGGLGAAEKKRVKNRVQEEVVRALTERMERWKAIA
ncbi:uncharacterized protein LOC62_01G000906 [Vanrija pseudolonga]|uniref:Borealin N-terminal domain-containing protein n=1 Tax=Vanrija pseudolonga TaxID=143232 RepID=A0AAF0Y437_9TREE|nr:hypothetical protein LOC62_01G000906 [Vanrija pseudolonga]